MKRILLISFNLFKNNSFHFFNILRLCSFNIFQNNSFNFLQLSFKFLSVFLQFSFNSLSTFLQLSYFLKLSYDCIWLSLAQLSCNLFKYLSYANSRKMKAMPYMCLKLVLLRMLADATAGATDITLSANCFSLSHQTK